MRTIKYIMVDLDTPILFPDHLTHADVAAKFHNVTSAGFCHVGGKDECGNPQFVCYGESYSLKLKAAANDSKIMNRTFGMEY